LNIDIVSKKRDKFIKRFSRDKISYEISKSIISVNFHDQN